MKKTAALLGIAAALTAGVAPIPATLNTTQVQQRVSDQQKPVEQSNLPTANKINPFGGFGYKSFGEYGIPPKIYGMKYVKRGTHKRTNK